MRLLKILSFSLLLVLFLVACLPEVDREESWIRNDQGGSYWNPVVIGMDQGYNLELPWHPINPPRPGLTCWAAEIREESGGYAGYGYSYVYCEPSS